MNLGMPLAILGFGGAFAMLLVTYWDRIISFLAKQLEPYLAQLDRAAIPARAEQLAVVLFAGGVLPWSLIEIAFRPKSYVAIALLLVTFTVAFLALRVWINMRITRRLADFTNQLEVVLQLIAGTMKVGLGMRQALVNVISDMPDPSRIEFMRVLSQTQIGVSLFDALDALAQRMPSSEMNMFAKTVRLQSQTGGSLAQVLENLALTIKERRRLGRKIRILTAEARATKVIITCLPVFVGVFIMSVEPDIRQGLLYTMVGRGCLAAVVVLLSLGWYIFDRISALDI
jgi:Flp pilus assembly protein TadB